MQSSWKSTDVPAKGEYTTNIDLRGYLLAVIKKGSAIKLRIGSWNGRSFTGYPTQPFKQKIRNESVLTDKEVYHRYEVVNRSMICVYRLSLKGNLQALCWTSHSSSRIVIYTGAEDSCDNYAMCGAQQELRLLHLWFVPLIFKHQNIFIITTKAYR